MCSGADLTDWEDEEVTSAFAPHSGEEKDTAVEDNKEVVWPLMRAQLKQYTAELGTSRRVLDFGCGAGQLAYDLAHEDGFMVVGLDPSSKMISRANEERKHPQVNFRKGTAEDLTSKDCFDAIAASLVLPFIEDLTECMRLLSGHLVPGGVLAFATFTPEFISWQIRIDSGLFEERASGLYIHIKKKAFRVFVRGANDYEDILAKFGFYRLANCYLVFSGDVSLVDKPVSRFLMMAFRKRRRIS